MISDQKRSFALLGTICLMAMWLITPAFAQRGGASRGANYARGLMQSRGASGAASPGRSGSNAMRGPNPMRAPTPSPSRSMGGSRPDGRGSYYRGDSGRRGGYRGGVGVGVYLGPGYIGPGYDRYGYPGYGYGRYPYDPYYSPYGSRSRSRIYVVPRYATPSRYTTPYATQTPRYLAVPAPDTASTVVASPTISPQSSTGPSPAVIATNEAAARYQAAAENALRFDQLQEAVRLARHAVAEDPQNGKAKLFLAQTLFAVENFPEAVNQLRGATDLLPASEWGYIVTNFKEFYYGQSYVEQMARLVERTKSTPSDADARMLRGYHYIYLGYNESAQRELSAALQLRPNDPLAIKMLALNSGENMEGAPSDVVPSEEATGGELPNAEEVQIEPGTSIPAPAEQLPPPIPTPDN